MSGVSTGGSGPSGDVVELAGFLCLTCLCVAAGVAFVMDAGHPSARRVAFKIDDTINPNDASPASLARLPRIGPARARGIVSYRSRFSEGSAQWPVFRRAEDLGTVTGIGPATIKAVRPWLSFDSHAPGEPDVAARDLDR